MHVGPVACTLSQIKRIEIVGQPLTYDLLLALAAISNTAKLLRPTTRALSHAAQSMPYY